MEDVYEIAYKEMVYNMIFDTINAMPKLSRRATRIKATCLKQAVRLRIGK